MSHTRREFLSRTGVGGVGLLTFTVAGCEKDMTPGEARARHVPFRVLNDTEVATLNTLGEVLLPGSSSDGLAHYIDHQLAAETADSMLMIKYLGVAEPFAPFYKAALAGAEKAATASFKKSVAELDPGQTQILVSRMAGGQVTGWKGPPPGLFYFVLRADAIDVVYGTREGFGKLDVPYMAHIEPPSRWGE